MIRSAIDWRLRFGMIWLGQSVSLFGSVLTQFVLVWWITETVGTGVALATAALAATAPQVLLGPVAGTLVDRWNRRAVMLVADALAALCIALLIGLFAAEMAEVWHIYGLLAARSVLQAFHQPAAGASTTLLVPTSQLARVAGLNQLVNGLSSVAAAPLGALALGLWSLEGALLIDVVTALAGIVPLLVFAIPQPPAVHEPAPPAFWGELRAGLSFVWRWPGLRLLLGLGMLVSAMANAAYALQPLIVRVAYGGDVSAVALIESFTGIGMVAGGLALSTWGGFRRRVVSCLAGIAGIGLGQTLTGAAPQDAFWLAVSGGLALGLALPFAHAPLATVIQERVPAAMQGRVLGLLNSVLGLAGPVGLVVAGPLADAVGVRVLYIGGGLAIVLLALAGSASTTLMDMEQSAPLVVSGGARVMAVGGARSGGIEQGLEPRRRETRETDARHLG